MTYTDIIKARDYTMWRHMNVYLHYILQLNNLLFQSLFVNNR